MKRLLLMVVAVVTMTANAGMVARPETLAASSFADTEACTNIACNVWRESERLFEITLGLTATPSNCVEIAFGKDVDGDGALGIDEIAFAVGWDCGRWKVRRGMGDEGWGMREEIGLVPVTSAERKVLKWGQKLSGGRARGLSVSENEVALATEYEQQAPSWFFDKDWNMMRVAVRGIDHAAERIQVRTTVVGFSLSIR